MNDMVSLRCKHCGAPLDESQIKGDSPYVTCEYCGTTQQRMDARKYMEDMVNQVKDWVAKSMPMGYSAGGMENVDPVARHSIFVKDIQPRLTKELDQIRFSNLALLGTCLLAMPFRSAHVSQPDRSSKNAFEFNAKVRSVSSLAVTDEDRALIDEATVVSETYALAVNNIKLLGECKDGRWDIMAKNFRSCAETMSKTKGYEIPDERYKALADVAEGFASMLNGDITTAYGKVKSGMEMLESIGERAMNDPKFMIMYSAIDQERNIAKMVLGIIDSSLSSSDDPAMMMDIIRKVLETPPSSNMKWNYLLNGSARYDEVFVNIGKAISSKTNGTIPIASGSGDVLIPFWEVDLRYTFTTGKLWKKRSVEVKEDLLVCADFVTDPECLNDPSSAMTDIFSDRPEVGFGDSFFGKEKSISSGQGIGRIQDSVSEGTANGRKVMMPLSTRLEAEKLITEYLKQRSGSIQQLKLGDPDVKGLIYVPCRIVGDRLELPDEFGALVPTHIGRSKVQSQYII